MDLLYTNQYYNVTDNDANTKLNQIFEEIYSSITSKMFTPVGGSNDLGVDDAITYKDPIGKYMEVKDVKGLSLFGEYYEITETATYSYAFNSAYLQRNDAQKNDDNTFKSGWYKGDDPNTALFASYDQTTELDEGDRVPNKDIAGKEYKNAEEAWADGWEYRLSSTDAKRFVPTLDADGTTGEKQQNTEYTFYRLHMKDTERRTLRMNPIYGDTVPDNVKYDGDNMTHQKTPDVYTLSDLRIWVEDTGDYSDSTGDTLTDSNYDEALYINIPANMLPLRTVTISQNEDGDGWTYTTNLPETSEDGTSVNVTPNSKESASFPLRVFYTVGIAEDIFTADRNIDIAGGVSAEYLQENKAKDENWAKARGLSQNDPFSSDAYFYLAVEY